MIIVDNDDTNADWLKYASWDLPTTVEAFLTAIRGAENWEQFKTLPAYEPMPESLRNDVDAYVRAQEANKALNKGNPDQPRDERGRFASTAGETQGGEAGRVLARDAIEAKVKQIKDDATGDESLPAGYGRDPAGFVKDHVANAMALAVVGKVSQPELADNPYARISHSEWDENGIDNAGMALVWDANNQSLSAIRSDLVSSDGQVFEYENQEDEGLIIAIDPENKEGLLAYATANGILSAWATSSNDNNSNSLAVQEVAESHFGIQGAASWDYAETATEDNVVDIVNKYEDLITANLDAQYDTTQQWFQEQGISEVTLYRGMEIDTPAGTQEVTMRPLSSWSLDPDQASAFGMTIFQATFPVDRILSIPTTGVGCLREQEVVVLGGTIKAEVTIDDVMGMDLEDEMP